MAVTSEQSAPYAPSSVILMLLERNRQKGLPNPVTAEALQRLGVSDSLVPRTLQAIKILDLVGEDGRHTEILDRLRRSPEAEYQREMAEWLKAAYEHAMDIIDPATSDEVSIRDAFRHYNPISMQPRMITLFTSLFEAAGVRSTDRPKASPKKAPAPSATSRQQARPTPRGGSQRTAVNNTTPPIMTGLHPALAGLLASLPNPEIGWTQDSRDRWYAAFGVVLDFAIPPGVVRTSETMAEGDDAPDA